MSLVTHDPPRRMTTSPVLPSISGHKNYSICHLLRPNMISDVTSNGCGIIRDDVIRVVNNFIIFITCMMIINYDNGDDC
jgi:hypothetical protein